MTTQIAQRPNPSSVGGVLRQMSQMVAESPALEMRRDKDRRCVVAPRRLLACVLILPHGFSSTPYRRPRRPRHIAARGGAPPSVQILNGSPQFSKRQPIIL